MKFKKVIVLAPHTDDGEIGAGGYIAKLIEEGAEVHYLAFSAAEDSVPKDFERDVLRKEVLEATSCLGISENHVTVLDYSVRKLEYRRQDVLEDLIKVRKSNNYDLVLVPNSQDIHQDHRTVHEEALRAFKGTSVFGYELLWNNFSVQHDIFVGLSTEHLEKKINALKCYHSQFGRSYVNEKFVRSLATVRGTQVGFELAECFEAIRLVMR
ncbi:PIG-L deacetylase family protein [Idiomarina sp. Sol25]|uniref:PIG-L deacetylase family protein n=1 Tax=Idiomarina sp. Sol25 TaxID=3064000 RepID=UPI00294AB3F3|nr:PIG-L deacetylase family protein [Idiomarina sp. Sol25]MDV6328081.1 PIG-L deacetylase family protein [Idiomarina sp. Sol25]